VFHGGFESVHTEVFSCTHAFSIGVFEECHGGDFVEGFCSRGGKGESFIWVVGMDAVAGVVSDRDGAEGFGFEEV